MVFQFGKDIINISLEEHKFADLIQTTDNGFLLCGEANHMGELTEPKRQRSWLVKLDEHGCLVPGCHKPVSASTVNGNQEKKKFTAAPNPVQNELHIYIHPNPQFQNSELVIMDLSGNLQMEVPIIMEDLTITIDVSSLPTGMFIISYLQNGQVVQVEQVVKM